MAMDLAEYWRRSAAQGDHGRVGDVVRGVPDADGVLWIEVDGELYEADRLMYQMHRGDLGTDEEVVHADGDRRNNAISNLSKRRVSP